MIEKCDYCAKECKSEDDHIVTDTGYYFCNECYTSKERLRDSVIEQINSDVELGDLTSLDELLSSVPTNILVGFLHEDSWGEFPKEWMDDNG